MQLYILRSSSSEALFLLFRSPEHTVLLFVPSAKKLENILTSLNIALSIVDTLIPLTANDWQLVLKKFHARFIKS